MIKYMTNNLPKFSQFLTGDHVVSHTHCEESLNVYIFMVASD